MTPPLAITTYPPFSDIGDDELKRGFIQTFQYTRIPPFTLVMNRNERVRQVGFICSGTVELLSGSDGREEYHRHTLSSGEFFGTEALFDWGLALFDGLTVEPVECYVIEPDRLFGLFSDHPGLRQHFEKILIKNMKRFIYDPVAQGPHTNPDAGRSAEEHRFSESMAYIDSHYSETLTLAKVAEQAGLSRFYFSRMFKKETGRSFKDYLNMKRLEAAKKLLQLPEMNISQACYSVGFNDVAYFARIFKRYEGKSPSVFRKKMFGKTGPG